MNKQSALVGLAGKAVGFAAGSVLPKALTAGYKGLVRPVARMAWRHPGMAITGAMLPSMAGGYMNAAGQKGLSSLPRSLPKFASGRDALHASHGKRNNATTSWDAYPTNKQGEEMSDKKYPSVFYQVEGFEKMAAEAVVAHRLVKKAIFGSAKKVIEGAKGTVQKSFTALFHEKALKDFVEKVIKDPYNATGYSKQYKNLMDEGRRAGALIRPKGLREVFAKLRDIPLATRVAGLAAVGIPAYYYAHKAYKNHQENKALDGSYRDMLNIYPELKNENPQNTRQYFEYIKQYSSTVAKNPHAAGAIVKRFASTGGMAMDNSVIKSLLEVEKVKSDAGRGHQGILGAMGAMI